MRVIIKRAYDNVYESIKPFEILWLETDVHGATVIVERTGKNPPTWRKISVVGTVEEVQAEVSSVVRKIRASGLYPNQVPSRETSTR